MDFPRSDIEKQKMLIKIAERFSSDQEYDEQQVNAIMREFGDDVALLRRELVNFNYLGKDSARGVYWLKKRMLSPEEIESIAATQKRMQEKNMF